MFDKWRMRDEKNQPIFKSFLEKLRALFYPPGYYPGIEVVPFFHWFSLKDHTINVPEVSIFLNKMFYFFSKSKNICYKFFFN